MPNPFHYRRVLRNLARFSSGPNPPHVRLQAAAALVCELSPANPRQDFVQRMLQDANPFEFARHNLRDLYDRAVSTTGGSLRPPLPLGEACPALDAGGWDEGSLAHREEEPPKEDDDPL